MTQIEKYNLCNLRHLWFIFFSGGPVLRTGGEHLRCRARLLFGVALSLHCSTTPTQRSCFGESLKMLSHFFNAPYVPQRLRRPYNPYRFFELSFLVCFVHVDADCF